MYEFQEFPKIPRLKREVVITEKLDGTNAQVAWVEVKGLPAGTEGDVATSAYAADAFRDDPYCLGVFPGVADGDSAMALYAGSRTRWLGTSSASDNYGFAKWVLEHADELRVLGPGRHYGEWFGSGIQRKYGLTDGDKRFALFNVARWNENNPAPTCCTVVPIILRGEDVQVSTAMERLGALGSVAVPGFMNPEGVVVFHSASRQLYKVTFKDDGGKFLSTPSGTAALEVVHGFNRA